MDHPWSTHHKQDFLFDNIRTLNNPRSLQNSTKHDPGTYDEISNGYLLYLDSFIRFKTVLNRHNGSTTLNKFYKYMNPCSKLTNQPWTDIHQLVNQISRIVEIDLGAGLGFTWSDF